MKENKLNFKLTEVNGDYGIIFRETEPVAFAMFNKEDFSLAVAFKKGERDKYSKGDVLTSVFIKTNIVYGIVDYSVIENNNVVDKHVKKYAELNN